MALVAGWDVAALGEGWLVKDFKSFRYPVASTAIVLESRSMT